MPPSLHLSPISSTNDRDIQQVVDIWNAACGDDLAVSPRLVTYNLQPSLGLRQAAVMAYAGETPVGFVAVSILPTDQEVAPPTQGWIDALAVLPSAQRQGIGSVLLTWAEGWLIGQGARTCVVGTGLRLFVPGVPETLTSAPFFRRHGYGGASSSQIERPEVQVWDVAANLATYAPPANLREVDALIRPAQPNDRAAILAFLQREFPGRWRYEFEEMIGQGGRIADFMVLWTADGIDGCCVVSFEDSLRPIERFFPYGLRRLHNNGVNGCVIDWTDLLDFYGNFGFSPYRNYLILAKDF